MACPLPAGTKAGLILQGTIAGEESVADDVVSQLGPLLPYQEGDEDLLLNVMITKQV